MTENDLIPYCFFYKGEAIIPSSYDHTDEGKLWVAEKFVCEELPNQIDKEEPRKSIALLVASYVGKWSPFKFHEVMDIYLKRVPDLRNYILDLYN